MPQKILDFFKVWFTLSRAAGNKRIKMRQRGGVPCPAKTITIIKRCHALLAAIDF
jgi:hypothetical protein